MVDELIPLQFLTRGETAQIDQLVGDASSVHRLEELGFRVGAKVQMVQPGSPCIVKLYDHKLSIRDAKSLQILVCRRSAG